MACQFSHRQTRIHRTQRQAIHNKTLHKRTPTRVGALTDPFQPINARYYTHHPPRHTYYPTQTTSPYFTTPQTRDRGRTPSRVHLHTGRVAPDKQTQSLTHQININTHHTLEPRIFYTSHSYTQQHTHSLYEHPHHSWSDLQ